MHAARAILCCLIALFATTLAAAGEWLTAPSYYTHDSTTGQRVTQYAQNDPAYVPQRADYQQSGFRYYQSDIGVGNTADRLHLVEEWGAPVRPYGEWQYPYRPYSVPYGAWGPPYGGLGYPAYYPGPRGDGYGNDRRGFAGPGFAGPNHGHGNGPYHGPYNGGNGPGPGFPNQPGP